MDVLELGRAQLTDVRARTGVLVVLIAAVIVIALLLVRAVRTRKALRPAQRVRIQVLPTDTFDPTLEEIDRYAAQLARTRRTVRKLTSRAAHGVRLSLAVAADGRVTYCIEGHRRSASILATPGYHEVELRPAEGHRDAGAGSPPPPDDAAQPRPPGKARW